MGCQRGEIEEVGRKPVESTEINRIDRAGILTCRKVLTWVVIEWKLEVEDESTGRHKVTSYQGWMYRSGKSNLV